MNMKQLEALCWIEGRRAWMLAEGYAYAAGYAHKSHAAAMAIMAEEALEC